MTPREPLPSGKVRLKSAVRAAVSGIHIAAAGLPPVSIVAARPLPPVLPPRKAAPAPPPARDEYAPLVDDLTPDDLTPDHVPRPRPPKPTRRPRPKKTKSWKK